MVERWRGDTGNGFARVGALPGIGGVMKARLFTQRDMIRRIPEQWQLAYREKLIGDRNCKDTYEKLRKLDLETCSDVDVARIIGNFAWTSLRCDGCGNQCDAVVHVGEEPDCESSSAAICKECICDAMHEAFVAFDARVVPPGEHVHGGPYIDATGHVLRRLVALVDELAQHVAAK
jgi:hypothetical protein